MHGDGQANLDEILQAAGRLPEAERGAYLNEACGGDAALREQVERLLAGDAATAATAATAEAFEQPRAVQEPAIPAQIGPFKIKRLIGQGGMGVVYLGVRAEGRFQQRAAVKVVKRGIDTDDVLYRFELERQLLSAMNHPNIARVFDGGMTDDGRPYFAVEYIEGLPIDAYCDRASLTIDQRLELFLEVCSAVRYAHRNLVVHRDLKPDNILVTEDGNAKLLDFGIAKILNPELTLMADEPTLPGARPMTPEYASPEQVLGEPITTASDVYSLGIILYELMTGHRPYRFRTRMPSELQRLVVDQEPDRPSTVISRVDSPPAADPAGGGGRRTVRAVNLESVSKQRSTRPDRLRRRLSGDIDNIILKAMRKSPQDRYPVVNELMDDIRRHLDGRPVSARPQSFGYRASRYFKRHKAGVAVAAAAVLVVCFAVATAFSAQIAATARAKAEADQIALGAQAQRAERRSAQVRELTDELLTSFHDAIASLAGSVRAREMIVRKAQATLETLEQEGEGDVDLMLDMAVAYNRLGQIQGGIRNPTLGTHENAMVSYDRAAELCEAVLQQRPRDPKAMRELAVNHVSRGDVLYQQRAYEEAYDQYAAALKLAQDLYRADPDGVEQRRFYAMALNSTGKGAKKLGRGNAALNDYRDALRLVEELHRQEPDNADVTRDLSVSYNRVAGMHQVDGDLQRAAELYGRALELRRQLRAANPTNNRETRDVAQNELLVGSIDLAMDDVASGSRHLQQYIDLSLTLAWASPFDARTQSDLARAHDTIATLYAADHDLQRALASARAYQTVIRRNAENDPANIARRRLVARSAELLGGLLIESGALDEAATQLETAVATSRDLAESDAGGTATADLIRLLAQLGTTLAQLNQAPRAAPLLEEAITLYGALGPDASQRGELEAVIESARELLAGLRTG